MVNVGNYVVGNNAAVTASGAGYFFAAFSASTGSIQLRNPVATLQPNALYTVSILHKKQADPYTCSEQIFLMNYFNGSILTFATFYSSTAYSTAGALFNSTINTQVYVGYIVDCNGLVNTQPYTVVFLDNVYLTRVG